MAAHASPFKQARRVEAARKGPHSPVGVLLGVGKKTAAILSAHRIVTVAQAASMNDTCFASLVTHGAVKPRDLAKIRESAQAAVAILTDASGDTPADLTPSFKDLSLSADATGAGAGPEPTSAAAPAAPACSLTGLHSAAPTATAHDVSPSSHAGHPEGSTGASPDMGPGRGAGAGAGAGACAGAAEGACGAPPSPSRRRPAADEEEGKGRVADESGGAAGGDADARVVTGASSGRGAGAHTGTGGTQPLPPSPYDDHPNVAWHCAECGDTHHITSRRAESPFFKKCGWRWMAKSDGIELDGDCFYNSVRCAVWGSRKNPAAGETVPSVKQLRDLVANEMGKEQLEFYQMMEQLTRTRSG